MMLFLSSNDTMVVMLGRYWHYCLAGFFALSAGAVPAWFVTNMMNLFAEHASIQSVIVGALVGAVFAAPVFVFTYSFSTGKYPCLAAVALGASGFSLVLISVARRAATTDMTGSGAIITFILIFFSLGFVVFELLARSKVCTKDVS